MPENYDPYAALAKKLQISRSIVNTLSSLNDSSHLTFSQVAKVAEEYFNSDQTTSIGVVYRELKEKGAL